MDTTAVTLSPLMKRKRYDRGGGGGGRGGGGETLHLAVVSVCWCFSKQHVQPVFILYICITSVSVCFTRTSQLIIGLHSPAGRQQPAATPLMFS